MLYPTPIAKLIDSYSKLPGIGIKTATRPPSIPLEWWWCHEFGQNLLSAKGTDPLRQKVWFYRLPNSSFNTSIRLVNRTLTTNIVLWPNVFCEATVSCEQTQGLIWRRTTGTRCPVNRVLSVSTSLEQVVPVLSLISKLRFMRLGVSVKPWPIRTAFAWTTSIMDENCLILGSSLSGTTRFYFRQYWTQMLNLRQAVVGRRQKFVVTFYIRISIYLLLDLVYAYFWKSIVAGENL